MSIRPASSRPPQAPGAKIDFNALRAPANYGGDDDSKFDEFLGNDGGVLAGTGAYDDEDREADAEHRDARMKEELERFRAANPRIGDLFTDLKRGLAELDASAWEAIPEIGDTTVKRARRAEIFTPVPDSLLARAAATAGDAPGLTSLDPGGVGPGTETPGAATSLTAIGAGRSTVVQLKLDRLSDSVTGQTVVDPRGYLTDLKSVTLKSDAEISDIKKARLLLKSVIKTNPAHGPGWVAAARLEEVAGKLPAARELALKGCELAPGYVDVWLEAARLQEPENAKAILARGVAALPEAVTLWMAAAKLETSDEARKRVLLRALERIPQSVRLWKAVVEISDEDDARILLHVELWLALARLESYKNAQKVLNRARQAIPTSAEVWITAAKLEESAGQAEAPAKIIPRGLKSLQANGVVLDREWWLHEAEAAERTAPPLPATCRAIVAAGVDEGVEAAGSDNFVLWVLVCPLPHTSVPTYRMILARAREHPPASTQRVWMKSAIVEREAGDAAAEAALLEEGLTRFPTAWKLHLMAGALAERQGEVERARAAYHAGIKRCLDCVPLWIAAAALEEREGALARARALLEQARLKNPGQPALWLAAARTEARAGNAKAAEAVLARALQACPDSGAVWAESIRAAPRPARRSRSVDALKRCNDDPAVVAAVAQLFWGERKVEKARSWFDRAVTLDPDVGDHWALYLRFEAAHGTPEAAAAVLERAVAAEPRHGERWQALAKDPVNAHQPLGTLLKKLAQTIEKDMAM
ncbi:Pre-mRNA-processing factor 6 [Auxenochlorella protothecoides]|uniref:Pre-mRNA-processing factor 6 n=1 Tax=Auxenochlorella protothecoides TaxID=3075 RepID=A0A087SMI3_AUXPR|nr:Pre-mRNA-processing factor 6 [Auxenochlorella protothecoides]KFM26937.1 Pre-mRNA-processing factor 6 [Auxenochlorella protothecoides]